MRFTQSFTSQQRGSVLVALSALFYASYGIWSKLMTGVFSEFNQAWIRAALLLAVLFPFGVLTRSFQKIRPTDRKWFVIISLAGGLNQAPYFYGFRYLPVGTATLLFYVLLTLGAFIIGKFFFAEKITRSKYVSLVLGIIGLFLLYRFSLSTEQIIPALLTCLSGCMGAGIVVFSKKLSSNYSETQILTSVFISMFFGNLVLSLLLQEPLPELTVLPWAAQILYAITMLIANAMVVAGFRFLEPSIGGLLGLLEVIFAIVLGVIFFQESVTPQMMLGSVCILLAAALPNLLQILKKGPLRKISPNS
jgi:drug/metabolite transporter (DMT)-like permease